MDKHTDEHMNRPIKADKADGEVGFVHEFQARMREVARQRQLTVPA